MVDPKFQPKLSNAEKWGRNPHIAFSVTDLNQAIIRLQSFNFSMQMSESRPALFTRDPDGNIIEINQL